MATAASDVGGRDTVVVLAFGTRGDVQPLAVLADGLRRRGIEPSSPPDAVDVVFVSHAEHGPFLHQLWSGTRAGERAITFVATPSPPHAATVLKGSEAHSRETVEATLRPPAHLQACIDAYRLPDGGRRLRLLVANLFALEAVHLAEALDVPLVMAHPYPAPCPAPAAFARQFRRVDPLGYNMLRQAGPGIVAWEDVEHWLWPVMTDAWLPFRRMLGLAEDDGNEDEGAAAAPCHHHLLGRPAPPLLYLYSETVLPRPDYFPARAVACGYIWPDALVDLEEAKEPPSYTPSAVLASFLTDAEPNIPRIPPVLVTFGTMVSLGALGPSLDAAAQVLAAAFGFDGGIGEEEEGASTTLRQQGVRVILDAADDPAWAGALRRTFQRAQGRLILEEPVPHSWLLRKCSVVLHHGGSGTTAAALHAGVAQVILPMMMDQFLWAERVAWLDLGPTPLSLAAVFPSTDAEMLAASPEQGPAHLLTHALSQALQPATRLRAAAFGRRLRAEEPSGLERCLELIRAHMQEWPERRASVPACPPLPPLPAGCELLTLEPPAAPEEEGHKEEEEEEEEEECGFTVAALKGSEAEVAFCCQEIFPPGSGHQEGEGWGYLRHGVRVKEGDVVLDVGANIGLFALYLDKVRMDEPEQLALVCVEPAPRTFAALEYNLRRHGVKHRAVRAAVGETPGSATLTFYPHMPGNATVDAARATSPRADLNPRMRAHLEAGKEAIEVRVTTIPLLLQSEGLRRVDLLKVDVEGHEEAVLRGMDAAAWACVRQLAAEVHDRGGARARIDALLRGMGGFTHVVWERPAWAESAAQGEGAMDNVMVFATKGVVEQG